MQQFLLAKKSSTKNVRENGIFRIFGGHLRRHLIFLGPHHDLRLDIITILILL
jgi:hypothetical protein